MIFLYEESQKLDMFGTPVNSFDVGVSGEYRSSLINLKA